LLEVWHGDQEMIELVLTIFFIGWLGGFACGLLTMALKHREDYIDSKETENNNDTK
jgi:hypothetical protein